MPSSAAHYYYYDDCNPIAFGTALDVTYAQQIVTADTKQVFLKYKKLLSSFVKRVSRVKLKDVSIGMVYVAAFLLGLGASTVFMAYTAPLSALYGVLAAIIYNYGLNLLITNMLKKAEALNKQGKLSADNLATLQKMVRAYRYGTTAADIAGARSAVKLVKTFRRAGVISIIQQKRVLRFLRFIYFGRNKITSPENIFKILHLLNATGLLKVDKLKRLLLKAFNAAKKVKDINPRELIKVFRKSKSMKV